MSASDRSTGPATGGLEVRGLVRAYEDFRLGPISLAVDPGQTLVVLGPNGSGKSTLLRLLAGLEPVDAGQVLLGHREITALPPPRRGIGMVFQDLALFPQKTVWENLVYGLVVRREPVAAVERRGEELLDEFALRALSERLPSQLSGGERQRVALARALAPRPELLLMDEPLAAADPRVARELVSEVRGYLSSLKVPTIYVTHDFEEGSFLADRVAVLDQGTCVEEGPADRLFDRPQTPFAAWFLGFNVLPAPLGGSAGPFAVHPEEVLIAPADAGGDVRGTVRSVGRAGRGTRLFVELAPEAATGSALPWVEVLLPPTGPPSLGPRAPPLGSPVALRFSRRLPLEGELPPDGFKRGRLSRPSPESSA